MNRDDAIEDAADVAMYDARTRELEAGNDVPLSADVSAAILRGESARPSKIRRTLIAAALFGFTAWAIVTFAMMVEKWTSQVQVESKSNVTHTSPE